MASSQKKVKEIGRSQSMPVTSPMRDRKSATLPANSKPMPSSSGEGFFTKLKRCLRIGSRGRYNVNSIQSETLQVQPNGSQETGQVEKNRNVVSRATSLRLSRRAHPDKEDVVLIHKSKMKSGNGLFLNRSVSETIPEDGEQTIVHIVNGGTSVEAGQTSGAEAAAADIDDVFEMDPGYETLDEIRKKVKLQAAKKQDKEKTHDVQINNVSNIPEPVKAVSKPNDLGEARNGAPKTESGRDSGITTPTTESPESGRDSQVRSVTSSMFSDSALTEESNQVDTIEPEEITRGGTMHRLNSCPADSMSRPHRDGHRYCSDSFLTKPLQDDTDTDLYANPQILFRKQSKMGKNKAVSASTITVGGDAPTDSLSRATGLGEKSVSEGDIKPLRGSSVESDTTAPPLPDRKYLDSDSRASRGETDDEHSADNDCSTSTTISANNEISQSATHDSVNSIISIKEAGVDNLDNLKTPEAGSPARTPVVSLQSDSAVTEHGPSVAGSCDSVSVHSTEPPNGFVSRPSVGEVTLDLTKLRSTSDRSPDVYMSDGTVDTMVLDSNGSAPSHNDASQSTSSVSICTDDVTRTQSKLSSKSNSCEEIPRASELSCDELESVATSTQHKERTEPLESASQLLSQSLISSLISDKSMKIPNSDSNCESPLSRSQESIPESKPVSSVVDQTQIGAQNTCSNLQTAEGCDGTSGDIIYNRNKDDVKDRACSEDSDSISGSVVVEKRNPNLSESSDASCAPDNVVVIKLHESTHEDSLTGEEGLSEEGVSDESIARLEEKATMLKLSAQEKDSKQDPTNKEHQSESTEAGAKCKTEHEQDSSSASEGAASPAEAVSPSSSTSSSAALMEGPVPAPRTRRSKKRAEPIHMTLAEVMNSKQDEDDGDCASDNDDYLDLENEDSEGQTEGAAAAATQQTSQNSTAAAHRAFLESMRQLKDCGWYWGPLSYSEAMSKLMNKPDGSFLVRDSSNENYILSLSFKCMGSVCHTRIEHNKGVFSFWSQPDSHGTSTIREFIEQAVRFSHTGKFLYFLRPSGPGSPPIAIRLLYPVSRFCRVPSLQHMCRFLILRWVRRDHIDVLPVPEKVKNYLRENQYYVETLEED